VVERLPRKSKALGSVPSSGKKKKTKTKKEKQNNPPPQKKRWLRNSKRKDKLSWLSGKCKSKEL